MSEPVADENDAPSPGQTTPPEIVTTSSQDADPEYWERRRQEVGECDGDAWDEAHERFKDEWRAAFERKLVALGTGRYAGPDDDLPSAASEASLIAFDEVSHEHTPAYAAEREWADWCHSAAEFAEFRE